MMQSPLVGYPSFSHFLQYSSRTPASANIGSTSPPPHFMYSSAFSPSPSPNNAKSFTIDAILGLREGSKYPSIATDLSVNRAGRQDRHQSVGLLGLHSSATFTTCTRRNTEKSSESLSTSASKKSAKSKRVRTIFTPEQLERLEAEFERQQYMVGPERLYLAHALQLTEAQVKVWFQNRRIKWRKQHLEMQQQRLAAIKQQQLQQQQLHGDDMEDSDTDSNSGDDNSCYSNPTPAAVSSGTVASAGGAGAAVDSR